MKFSFPLFLLVCLFSCLSQTSQAQWIRQYPLDKLSDVLDMDVHSDGHGFAVGTDDLILRLDGETMKWDLLPGFGEGWRFESVDYLEGSGGNVAAAGGEGLILTMDKGENWDEVAGAPADIHTVRLFSPTHIIAIGDAGAYEWENNQWTDLEVPATVGIKGAFILDDQRMWVHTFATDPFIYYTTDGGDTWNTNSDIEDADVIIFYDAMNGIASDGRKIYNTSNGGVNWTLISTNKIHNTSNDITFGSSLNVLMAATFNADPAVSTDGGLTWTQLSTELINQRSYSIASLSDNEFWLGGDLSGMGYSDDQGLTWTERSGPVRNLIQDVFFVTRTIGFALGQKGMLLRTFDGGENWEDISFGDKSNLSIFGLTTNDLWLGSNQRIYHSADTGATWTESLVLPGGNLNDILAISSDRILAATSNGVILRSNDAGVTWDTTFMTNNQIRSLAKIDAQRYMATGFNGIILRSEDQGATWHTVSVPDATLQYEQTQFIDDKGWLITSSFKSVMWSTVDAGDTWTPINLPIDRFWDGAYFISQDTGIIVGRTSNEGRVYITYSGGQSWESGYVTSYPLYGVTGFPHPNGTAWIYGYGSDIEKLPYCNAFPSISNFQGDLFPCEADTVSYTITGVNIDEYNWHFPAGWVILGNTNNDSLNVVVGSNSGIVAVNGSNLCGSSNQLNFSAGSDLLPVVLNINGDLVPCAGDVISLDAISIGADTFQWTLPSDWQFINEDDEQSILVFVGHASGLITLRVSNQCGSSNFAITSNPFTIPNVQVIVDENLLSLSANAATYQWYLDGELIAGAVNATYTATVNGSYHAELVFLSGCNTISDTVEVLLSGINNINPSPVSIYPVPATEKIFLDGIHGEFEYTVTDLTGRKLKEAKGSANSIDIGYLSGGLYILNLSSQGIRYVARFIRE